MALVISNETKNNLTITNEAKSGVADTWAQHTEQWQDAGGTFGAPGMPITKEQKNSLTITNEAKN